MRKSNEEAARTRQTIVATAADEIRRLGIAEASVADVMAAAGLTPGGFYRHFENKDQLVAEALEQAGDRVAGNLRAVLAKGQFDDVVDAYINPENTDGKSTPACPISALGSEIARSGPETREAITKVMEEMFSILGSGSGGSKVSRRNGIFTLAVLVGSLTLARIGTDEDTSREILNVVRQKLHRAG
ncbi:MAG: TetR/AcrR family transcriptional regulator [Rhizobiaceae bacterium]|nr:TetR/AcrR family transcriptional regulator [Rhizobiaceae bacterium]